MLFACRLKELVLDEERQHIALAEHFLAGAFSAVELDAFFAQIFVHQRFGHGLEVLQHKLVQALTGVVFFDCDLFQIISPVKLFSQIL